MKSLSGDSRVITPVNDPGYDEFKSDLGNVAVSAEHVERQIVESKWMDMIRDEFDEEELVTSTHFSHIEAVEFEDEEVFPNIKLKVDGEWKRLFFHGNEDAEECFRKLKYKLNVFRQNYQ